MNFKQLKQDIATLTAYASDRKATVAGVTLLAASLPSFAAIDVTTVTAGITEAGVAILAVIAALLALSVSIFGLVKVYGFVKRKAGA